MTDGFGRTINYLRVSVTDRCNLRCRYCTPEEDVPRLPHAEVLRYDEITRLVRIMAGLGVCRVRLTGGEPLVRRGVAGLAAAVKQVPGIGFLGLTTNGVLLCQQAEALADAGVDGLNISLDTTDPVRYAALTCRDEYPRVRAGLEKALGLPFARIKLNCVLAPDSREADWLGVVALARDLPVDVRLIEWMPLGGGDDGAGALPSRRALARIEEAWGPLAPLPPQPGGGPAEYWQAAGFAGRIGVIHAMSHRFCAGCNRLRLTTTGDLKLCLFYDAGVALKPLLRDGAGDDDIAGAILEAVKHKPEKHAGARRAAEDGSAVGLIDRPCGMYATGG